MNKSKIAGVVRIEKRTGKLAPVSMSRPVLRGKRVVISAAKRVIKTHSAVIQALTKR